MKYLLSPLISLFVGLASGDVEVKNYDRSQRVEQRIEGSELWRVDSYQIPAGSSKRAHGGCRIGYRKVRGTNHATGAPRPRIDPVIITLPTLKEDSYVIAVVNGWLKVTRAQTGQVILFPWMVRRLAQGNEE